MLVEQLPAVVFLERNDDKRTIEYISPRIQQLLGYTTEEWMEGRKLWEDSIHPDERRRVLAVHGVGPRRRSTSSEEYRLRRKDGVFIWVREEAHAVAVEGGQPLFWQGILLDITDRKQAEQSLQRQLAELTVLHRLSAAVAAGISQDELIRETTDPDRVYP